MGFTQGVSGLQAASADLNNIGNNIANSQTTGYKSSSTQFADIYAGARTGLGVAVAGTAQDFSAGSLNTTDRNLDVAIDGGGFFRLAHNGITQYSRDGQFQQTKNGNLANSSGALLTGYNVSNFNNPNADRIGQCRRHAAGDPAARAGAECPCHVAGFARGRTGCRLLDQVGCRFQGERRQHLRLVDAQHGLRLARQRAQREHVFHQDRLEPVAGQR